MGSEGDSSDWDTESDDMEESAGPEVVKRPVVPPLLPVPIDLTSPGDRLCDTCKALELTPRRFVVLPGDLDKESNVLDNPSIPLGPVKDILGKRYCPLCRLVIVALGGDRVQIPEFDNEEPTSIEMDWDTVGPKPNPYASWNHKPQQIRVLRPYCQTAGGGYVQSVRLNAIPEITLLANDSPVPATTFFARPIPQDKIDFGLVQNWFSLCETWHGEYCNKAEMLEIDTHPADEIPAFRFIDVIDHCLVRGESKRKYAALSYVWGRMKFLRTLRDNVEKLEEPGALKLPEFYDEIPWTIRDAIQTVRDIGLRYLWVDSLCIVQDDTSGEKAEAISKMDLVYGAAFVTIVAATGDNANAGLPGVRPGTRGYCQPIEELMPGLRLAVKSVSADYMEDSVYKTRGWTFQEKLFSKRSLRFIGGQVVFQCRGAAEWREDVVFEDETGIFGDPVIPRGKNDIGEFEGLVQSYSDLRLTYDSDIYNAFAGIAKYITRELKSNLCHGIPEAYFDWFLLWSSLKPQKRRENAPSWSWSGWIGGSWSRIWKWYTQSMKRVGRAQRNRTWIIWYQRMAQDSGKCSLVWNHNNKSSKSRPKNFYGGPIQRRFDLDCSRTVPTPRKLDGAPKYTEDILNPCPGTGFLQFWTVSVTFRLDTPTSRASDEGPPKIGSGVGIFGQSGEELGIVFVDESWRMGHVPGEHEFILLCEGRDKKAETGREDDEDGWKYMVMLLEWHGEWAERVSVGSIEKHGLYEALGDGPLWKEIILG